MTCSVFMLTEKRDHHEKSLVVAVLTAVCDHKHMNLQTCHTSHVVRLNQNDPVAKTIE